MEPLPVFGERARSGPEQFEIVTDMPMTPTRKIMKAELVRRFLARSGTQN